MLIIANDRNNLLRGHDVRNDKRPGIAAAPAPPHLSAGDTLSPVLSFLALLTIGSFLKHSTSLKIEV